MANRLWSMPFLLLLAWVPDALAQTTRPVPSIERVLIISVDGMRPDVMLRANMPNVRALMSAGCFSTYAVTTDMAVTLPSHTSMLTGVTPDRHGIKYNGDEVPEGAPLFPRYPTLFELAKKAGYTTALVAGKSKFDTLGRQGTCDTVIVPNPKQSYSTEQVGDFATSVLTDQKPQVMAVHFGAADGAGHKFGWGTPEQLAALERIDTQIGRIVTVLDDTKLRASTLLIISADHGGSGLNHGANDPRSRFIPWIASAPDTLKDFDLTRFRDLQIRTEDTFATACFVLAIPPGDDLDGHPVRRIFPSLDLMQDTPTPATAPATKPVK